MSWRTQKLASASEIAVVAEVWAGIRTCPCCGRIWTIAYDGEIEFRAELERNRGFSPRKGLQMCAPISWSAQ